MLRRVGGNSKRRAGWPAAYYQRIIRGGGTAVGASSFMPPWQDELSMEQVADILTYLDVMTNPVGHAEQCRSKQIVFCAMENGETETDERRRDSIRVRQICGRARKLKTTNGILSDEAEKRWDAHR